MSVRRSLSLLAACLAAAPAMAAALLPGDPTQPPAGFSGGGAGVDAVAGLTSIVLPRGGRPVAVIDGERVGLGDTVRGARLTRIFENGVVLEGPGGVERLFLTPDVEKTMKPNETKAAARPDRKRN